MTSGKCSPRCAHRLVWEPTTDGKVSQVRECQTKRWAASNAGLADKIRRGEPVLGYAPPDLIALVRKAVSR